MIRTRDLYVPNVALYQAEPHSDVEKVSTLLIVSHSQKKSSDFTAFFSLIGYCFDKEVTSATPNIIIPPNNSLNVGISPRKINA